MYLPNVTEWSVLIACVASLVLTGCDDGDIETGPNGQSSSAVGPASSAGAEATSRPLSTRGAERSGRDWSDWDREMIDEQVAGQTAVDMVLGGTAEAQRTERKNCGEVQKQRWLRWAASHRDTMSMIRETTTYPTLGADCFTHTRSTPRQPHSRLIAQPNTLFSFPRCFSLCALCAPAVRPSAVRPWLFYSGVLAVQARRRPSRQARSYSSRARLVSRSTPSPISYRYARL